MLKDGTYHEDVGFGMSEHPKKGSAIENAKKVLQMLPKSCNLFTNRKLCLMQGKEHCACLAMRWEIACMISNTYKF